MFLTQGSNLCLLCLLHCRQILYRLSHSGKPLGIGSPSLATFTEPVISFSKAPRFESSCSGLDHAFISEPIPVIWGRSESESRRRGFPKGKFRGRSWRMNSGRWAGRNSSSPFTVKVLRIRSDRGITTTGDPHGCGICHTPRLRPPSPQRGDRMSPLAQHHHTLGRSQEEPGAACVCDPGVWVPSPVCSPWSCALGEKWPNCAQPQFPHLENGNNRTSSIGSQQGSQEKRVSVPGAIPADFRGSINDFYFFNVGNHFKINLGNYCNTLQFLYKVLFWNTFRFAERLFVNTENSTLVYYYELNYRLYSYFTISLF